MEDRSGSIPTFAQFLHRLGDNRQEMKRALGILAVALVAVLVVWANWPEPALPAATQITAIAVDKKAHSLTLMDGAKVVRVYRISIGRGGLAPKQREGDHLTPEGAYQLDKRNPKSWFHFALHISYPNPGDIERASGLGVSPGSMIELHGLPRYLGFIGSLHRLIDWTDGCVAVTDPEIDDIGRVVHDGTPITIYP